MPFSLTSSPMCSVGLHSGVEGDRNKKHRRSGTGRTRALCHPAPPRTKRTVRSSQIYKTSSWNSDIVGVLHLGQRHHANRPQIGSTAANAYKDWRTTCLGTVGRIGRGAQQSACSLMRPKRPSSMNKTVGVRPSRARKLATSASNFFKSRLGCRIFLRMAGSWRHFTPTRLRKESVEGGRSD